jgi:hypothetical protein
MSAMAKAFINHLLSQTGVTGPQSGNPVDHIDHEVEPIQIVQHHHVKRCRRRPFLYVPAHVDIGMVRAPVGEAMDQPRIAVVRKYHRLTRREQGVELGTRHAVGMLSVILEPHEIDDVDDSNLEMR